MLKIKLATTILYQNNSVLDKLRNYGFTINVQTEEMIFPTNWTLERDHNEPLYEICKNTNGQAVYNNLRVYQDGHIIFIM